MSNSKSKSKSNSETNTGSLFDLETQFSFYGAYHSHIINILIHVICVPIILWTAMIFVSNTGPLLGMKLWPASLEFIEPNLGVFVALIYGIYYILLEPLAGIMYFPFVMFLGISATWFRDSFSQHNQIALYIHIICWILQFVGHGLAEGRSPALLDNFVQALLLAPFFVYIETIFYFGYRPKLRKRIEARIQSAIKNMEAKKGEKTK